MYRKIWFLTLFLSLSLTFCYAQAARPTTQEPPEHPAHSWDFGQIKKGLVARHEFVFRNTSAKALTIKNVTTSCGCTASEVKKKTLKPRESTLIKVSFNSKGYSGRVQQFVYVNTDNLDNPVVKYIIKANVVE
jgi:hypothetical protein